MASRDTAIHRAMAQAKLVERGMCTRCPPGRNCNAHARWGRGTKKPKGKK